MDEENICSLNIEFDEDDESWLVLNNKKLEEIPLCVQDYDDSLVGLYLSGNKIKKIDKIHSLWKLRKLDLSNNEIEKVENVTDLEELEDLNLSNNKITDIGELKELEISLPNLYEFFIHGNPIPEEDKKSMRRALDARGGRVDYSI